MDLNDEPIAPPIISESIVVKPENQNNITKSNGNKNISFFLPDYIRYFLPNQSYFQANIQMTGRGRPIPSPTAAFHSFWRKITARDGQTNSHVLQETDYYNTLVGQQYTYQKTDQLNNQRLMFEGLQANDSYDNNLYWEQEGGKTWAAQADCAALPPPTIAETSQAPTSKEVQVSTTLKTDLLNTEKFIPLNVLGGLHLQLEVEDFRRSLEYTTGNLAMGRQHNMCPGSVVVSGNITGGFDLSNISAPGVLTAGHIYSLHRGNTSAGDVIGFVQADSTSVALGLTWYCSASGFCPPDSNTPAFCLVDSTPTTPLTITGIKIAPNTIFAGKGRAQKNAPYYVDIGVGSPKDSLGTAATIPSVADQKYGNGTLRQPFRVVNPQAIEATSGITNTNCVPNNNNPFTIGDRLLIQNNDGTNDHALGYICGFSKSSFTSTSGSAFLRVYYMPDCVMTGTIINGQAAPTGASDNGTNVPAISYDFTAATGYGLSVFSSDRINGSTPANIVNTDVTFCPDLISQASSKVDFTIKDLQYSVKRVMMDPRVDDSDMALARGSGYNLDIEATTTSLVNVVNVLGPTNQNIAIPNIKRALGVLSIPLNQNTQFDITAKSLNGDPTGSVDLASSSTNFPVQKGLDNYQYDLGAMIGRQPYRPVLTEKYSFNNPLIQTQAVSELIKANESFGYQTSNLSGLGLNFAVGRAFARVGQYFDLMSSGNLQLLANYENTASGNKLFTHFIKHLRRVSVSGSGISIQN